MLLCPGSTAVSECASRLVSLLIANATRYYNVNSERDATTLLFNLFPPPRSACKYEMVVRVSLVSILEVVDRSLDGWLSRWTLSTRRLRWVRLRTLGALAVKPVYVVLFTYAIKTVVASLMASVSCWSQVHMNECLNVTGSSTPTLHNKGCAHKYVHKFS